MVRKKKVFVSGKIFSTVNTDYKSPRKPKICYSAQ